MRHVLILLIFLLSGYIYAQEGKIYLFKDRYQKSEQIFIERHPSRFSDIKVMTANNLLTNRKIDYRKVEENLNRMYPLNGATGILCIDLENEAFRYLKSHSVTRINKVSNKRFQLAKNDFINLIRFIKKKRPKLQVGYFELPFRVFAENEFRPGSKALLDDIIKESDIIMPSLYIPYPAKHVGIKSNLKFLDINLKNALESGIRLNKPVLPFVWYFIFSPDSRFSYEIIPKDEMKIYTDYIFEYTFQGKKVGGLIWWDSAVPFYPKNINSVKQNYVPSSERKDRVRRSDLFYYYFGSNN